MSAMNLQALSEALNSSNKDSELLDPKNYVFDSSVKAQWRDYNREILREYTGLQNVPLEPEEWSSPYNVFLRQFFETHKKNNPEVSNCQLFRDAYIAYSSLSFEEKSKYIRESLRDKDRYDREMALFHKYKKALKPAPTPFKLFVKHVSKIDCEERSYTEISQYCSERWKVMIPLEKEHFITQSGLLGLRRWGLIDRLRRGENIENLLGSPLHYWSDSASGSSSNDSLLNEKHGDKENDNRCKCAGPADDLEPITSSEDETLFGVSK